MKDFLFSQNVAPLVQQNCWVLYDVSMDELKAWWEPLKVPSTYWQILEAYFFMSFKQMSYFSKSFLVIFVFLFEFQLLVLGKIGNISQYCSQLLRWGLLTCILGRFLLYSIMDIRVLGEGG